MKHKIYLENTPLEEAIEKWTNKLIENKLSKPLKGEQIKVIDSLGRITAEPVFAKLSSPFYHSSAMDGYAVRFTDTFGAVEGTPKQLKIPEQAVYVSTGDPVPEAALLQVAGTQGKGDQVAHGKFEQLGLHRRWIGEI